MKKIFGFILILIFSLSTNAQQEQSIFEQANKAYREAKFAESAQLYEKILSDGLEAPELYFNLANAYYRQNKVGLAILNYEKALLLAPNDKTIEDNLGKANLLVKQKINPIPEFFVSVFLTNIRHLFSLKIWTILSISSFFLALIFASFFIFSSQTRTRKYSFIMSMVFLFSFAISYVFAYKYKNEIVSHRMAIVMKPSVDAQSSPDKNGMLIFTLSEGVKIEITDIRQDWIEIKLADGKIAWLPADTVELI